MYLEIEDLASNALIELMKAKNERFVSYKDMEIYGEAVAKSIIGNGDGAILLLSRDRTTALYESYPELFEERARKGQWGVSPGGKVRGGSKEISGMAAAEGSYCICKFRRKGRPWNL